MARMVFIFFTLVLRIESKTIQATKKHIQPKPSEILTIFRATSGINDIEELNGSIEGVCIRTADVNEFFQSFQTNVKQMEDVFDRIVFDYVVENLWEYCARVRCLLSEQENVNGSDIKSIKFDETFDYCIVTYLFDSDKTNDRVDSILNVIYYFHSLPYIQFSNANDMKKNIDETMDYVIDTIKLFSGDDPGDLEESEDDEYSTAELIDELRNIRSKISKLSKTFCSTTAPPIMNINLIREPKILDSSSKFIRSILYSEKIYVTYEEFHYENNKPQYIILDWKVDQKQNSTVYQCTYYTELVTTDMSHLHTEVIYSQEQTVSLVWPIDESAMTMKTEESLNTLLNSLKTNIIYDRRSYCNAVQYHSVMVDVLMVVATKVGYRMLRGIKFSFADVCWYVLRGKPYGKPFTEDMVNMMRTQLLQFRFYYGKMIDVIRQRLNVILNFGYEAYYYYSFHELTIKILSLIDTSTPLDVILKKNCGTIESKLGVMTDTKITGEYFDVLKFQRYHFIDPTRYMYEIYDYFSSFLNYHLNVKSSFRLLELPSLLTSFLNKPVQKFVGMLLD